MQRRNADIGIDILGNHYIVALPALVAAIHLYRYLKPRLKIHCQISLDLDYPRKQTTSTKVVNSPPHESPESDIISEGDL